MLDLDEFLAKRADLGKDLPVENLTDTTCLSCCFLSFSLYYICFISSGEAGFKAMMAFFGWAKHPMVNRIADMEESIPLTMIHGAESWMDTKIGYRVKQLRKRSSVDVKVNLEAFNQKVNNSDSNPYSGVELRH